MGISSKMGWVQLSLSTAVARFSVRGTVSRYSIYGSLGLLEGFGIPVCRLHPDGEIDRFRQTESASVRSFFCLRYVTRKLGDLVTLRLETLQIGSEY